MANLITKKLAKLPIGTHVELTYGDGSAHHDQRRGVITDSDFASNIELTTETGEELILDFAIIRLVQPVKTIDAVLKELSAGTSVRFSYGSETNREPEVCGTVVDNDEQENIEIRTDSGKELVLNYGLIRSLLVQKKAASLPRPIASRPQTPVPQKQQTVSGRKTSATPLHLQTPEDILNASDNRLKELFEQIPREERQKLSGAYDSFKYGIRVNDRSKMTTAAKQARQILFHEEDQGYFWSAEAARFCGCLLRRVNVFDHNVFLTGECFREAAFSCWREEKYAFAGVFAVMSLLEEKPENPADLTIILATAIHRTNDCSALPIVQKHLPEGYVPYLNNLVSWAYSVKGIQPTENQDLAGAVSALLPLYPHQEMAQEINGWLSCDDTGSVSPAAQTPAPDAVPGKDVQKEAVCGVISRLNWMDHTGIITADNGKTYTFRYQDLADAALKKTISDCLRADLEGKTYMVKFIAENNAARNIQPDQALVDRARALIAEGSASDRFEKAFRLCQKALETSDVRRAIADLVKHAMTLYGEGKSSYVKEALGHYEKYITYYPSNAFAVLNVAQCYGYLKKYPQMMEHAEKALAFPGLSAKQRIAVLSVYLKLSKLYYDASGDKALLQNMLKKIDEVKAGYSREFAFDQQVQRLYVSTMLPYRITAACGLDLLDSAEADLARIPDTHTNHALLQDLVEKTRARLAKAHAPAADVPQSPPASEPGSGDEPFEDAAGEDDAVEEEIRPYVDTDGWNALKTTEKEVIAYALNITGSQRIGSILAYLRAGAALSPKIAPVYHTVALAANDPMEAPDYSITALVNALAGSDSDYPRLNDCCMGAAYLRSSFLSGLGYDYAAQGLRDSISITRQLPALADAYDTLEAFRTEAGQAIDIYADYRNHGVKKLREDLDAAVRRADELYTKFVLTPAREGVKFARLLETKKILFARDGYLASMLRSIVTQNQAALEQARDSFITDYLNGVPQFSSKHISADAIDRLIVDSWEQAGKSMILKKANSVLQGDRRNNLRSNIRDILSLICQWYALSDQSAGLTWKNEQGEQAYLRLRPRLMDQLQTLHSDCLKEEASCTDPQMRTGLFLLAAAAAELRSRLDGSWTFNQGKYLYADFLRSDHITLDPDFIPELSSTFCVLPGFNILARIRRHVEGDKPCWQERINQIYGMDKTANNYGTAQRILEYLDATGQSDSAALPENPDRFAAHTQMQIEMRYRSFCETYALAMNYGQIIKSDAFCYTLEDTVRFWYAFARETRNYGFFTSILQQAENQIHASAQQYEAQLDEQLDALIAGNAPYFAAHPDYAEAIRAQIAGQNFTVAEDWMARIRIGDFSLEVQQPEALGYLEQFWNSYVTTYNRVADASRTLSSLLGRRDVRNKDTKRAQQLIDNWLSNGNPSNSERIRQLLNLLGWQNIHVQQYQFAPEPRAEIYEVRKELTGNTRTSPLHPIAAFGSGLEKKRMYVACLYGVYDCDRLYEKMRALDAIDGSKIILLDYAMGQADRRALARKLKKRDSALRSVNMVIDRVLITHLAGNYNENLINRILMATAMPFAYCQPYVVESVHTMPPEIFIGRKDELLKIEQPDGVNLIYGGRQLGKSALFKKALSDIDGHQDQRAVLIDIKELDCAAAARKLSTKLIDLDITPDAEITDDWDVLCRSIERRLRSTDKEIPYFLLMLDEADAFINDCAGCGYRPLVALKDVQQSLPGRFKYVLAGLHNIVKFNRQVALGNNSVITHMPSLKITPFRTPEAQELLTVPLSYLGFSLPSKVTVSQILATCNYFPGLIQLYAKKLIESIRNPDYAGYDIKKTPPYVVSDEHLRRVMSDKEFVEQIHEKFEITLTLDQDQGSCYYPLTLLIGWMYNVAPSKSGYTAKDVLYHARDLSVSPLAQLDEEKIDALLLELQDLNILRSVSNNSYLLASKNFRDLLGSDEEIFEKLMKAGGLNL